MSTDHPSQVLRLQTGKGGGSHYASGRIVGCKKRGASWQTAKTLPNSGSLLSFRFLLFVTHSHLVDLLHGAVAGLGSRRRSIDLGSVLSGLGLLVDVQTERDQLVDALGEAGGLVVGVVCVVQRRLEEELDDGLDRLVALAVRLDLLLELLDDGALVRDLERLLGRHVARHGRVAEGLGLHDALHVGRPAELAGAERARRADQLVRHHHLLHLVAENILEGLGQVLVLLLLFLASLLLLLRLLELEVLGDVHQLLALELLELRHGVLVDGVDEEQHLEALVLERVEEGRLGDGLDGLARDVVHVLLVLGHARDVVGQRRLLVARLGRVEAQQLGQGGAVLRVLVDAQLDVLGEGAVELVELLLVLGDLVEELERLLDDVLLDHLHDLVLLERLAGQVQGQVLRVDDTLDESQPLGDQVRSIVRYEDAADVQLDVVLGLLGLDQVEGSALGHEQDGAELKLALDGEVLDAKMVLPIVGERLVEGGVLLRGDVLGITSPDGLLLVELLLLDLGLLDLLGLLLLLLVFFLVIIYLLDLGLLVLVLLGVLGLLGILIRHLLLRLLLDVEVDGVRDELGVLLDDLLDLALVEVVEQHNQQVQDDLGTAAQRLALGVGRDGEGATSTRLPDVLLVIIVLGDDADAVGNQVCRVETNTELADHGDISTGCEGLHKLLGTRASDGTQVVDDFLRHTFASKK